MDPITGALISGGIQTIGGILGGNASSSAASAAEKRSQEIFNQYKNLTLPDIEKMQISPEMKAYLGDMVAKQEQAEQLSMNDQLQDVQLDPRLKQNQLNNLELLNKIASGGLTSEDRANLNMIRRETDQDTASRLASMLQTQDQRGVGTSDAALALRAGAVQSAANRQAAEADREAAMAMQRKMGAIASSSNLASQIDETDYNRQANLATALRNRETANLNERSGAQTRNVSAFNQAQRRNVDTRQGLSDSNTDVRNSAQERNKNLLQTDFNNRMNRLSGMSGAATSANNDTLNRGGIQANQLNAIGQTIGGGISSYTANQQKMANDLEIAKLTGKK